MSKEFKTNIENLNDQYVSQIQDRKLRKKAKLKAKDNNDNIYLIRFHSKDGESAFTKLEQDVTAVILNTEKGDGSEVYITIHSPGGGVTAYANAAQQIQRLRDHQLKVTGFVDEIAASGGYMMASVCDVIVAQPLSFVGSIGVVSQMPIVEELLKKIGVDFRTYTAGQFKRTVVPTKTPNEEEEKAFNSKLEEIHIAFKNHVLKYRPEVDADKMMQGDFYLAQDVIDLKMVDIIGDSNSYILRSVLNGVNVHEVKTEFKKKGGRLGRLLGVDSMIEMFIDKLVAKISTSITFDKFIK